MVLHITVWQEAVGWSISQSESSQLVWILRHAGSFPTISGGRKRQHQALGRRAVPLCSQIYQEEHERFVRRTLQVGNTNIPYKTQDGCLVGVLATF